MVSENHGKNVEDEDEDDSESSSDSDDYQDIPDALSSLNKERNHDRENSNEESDWNSDEESDLPDHDNQSDMHDSDNNNNNDNDNDNGSEEKEKKERMEEEDVDDVIEEGRLFIRNLPYSCTEEEIKSFMKQHGEITDVFIPLNAKRESKGFAFVTFMFPEQAILAIEVRLLKRRRKGD